MKIQQQVTNLELSKRMKELGVKQESLFYWVKGEMIYGYEGEWSIKESDKWFIFDHEVGKKKWEDYCFEVDGGDIGTTDEEYLKWDKRVKKAKKKMREFIYPAYTVAELGELLPSGIKGDNGGKAYLNLDKLENGDWEISYSEPIERCTVNPFKGSLVNAMAQMLIYLKENNLL